MCTENFFGSLLFVTTHCRQRGSKLLFGAMFFIILCLTSSVFAAPTINLVKQSPDSIVITGSNFGTKSTAPPIRFETFSGMHGRKVTDYGWWSTKNGDSQYSPSIRSDVSRVPGRNVADFSMDSNGTLNIFKNQVGFKSTRKVYVSWWAYIDLTKLDGVPIQSKHLTISRNTTNNSDNEYPDQSTSLWQGMDSVSSASLARYYANLAGSAPSLSYKDSSGSTSNIFKEPGWYNFAIQIDQGTIGVADGKTTMWLSGPGYTKYGMTTDTNYVMQINALDYLDSIKVWQYLQFRTTFTDANTFLTAYAAGYPVGVRVNYLNKGYKCIVATGAKGTFTQTPDVDTVHWVKVSDTPLTVSDTIYIDSLYIDNSWARVEICDAPSWDSRKHCEVQPITDWAEGKVSAKFNSGSFSVGQVVYAYLTDANGAVNSSGIKFAIGAPLPPEGVEATRK
jgi:hypothetical protein